MSGRCEACGQDGDVTVKSSPLFFEEGETHVLCVDPVPCAARTVQAGVVAGGWERP